MSTELSLEELSLIIKSRVTAKDQDSYSCKLINSGVEKVAKKVGEEAIEVCLAAFENSMKKDAQSKANFVGESCDLLYHLLLLLAQQNVDFELVKQELARRNKK